MKSLLLKISNHKTGQIIKIFKNCTREEAEITLMDELNKCFPEKLQHPEILTEEQEEAKEMDKAMDDGSAVVECYFCGATFSASGEPNTQYGWMCGKNICVDLLHEKVEEEAMKGTER